MREQHFLNAFRVTIVLVGIACIDVVAGGHLARTEDLVIAGFGALPVARFGLAAMLPDAR